LCEEMDMASYDPKTALIVVDIQNDFADPKGSLYVREGEKVVDVANREADRARAAGALLVYTQDWHPEVTPHFKKFGGVWPVYCVKETALDALRLGFATTVLREGVRAVNLNPGDGERALEEIRAAGGQVE